MIRRLPILLVTTIAALGLVACGPDTPPAAAPAGTGSPASHTSTPAAGGGGGGTVTPEQVCGLLSLDQASHATGMRITSQEPSMSGNVAVCTYKVTIDGKQYGNTFVQYNPTGKGLVEYTKSKGVVVPNIGQLAIWWKSSSNIAVELGGDAVLLVYVMDVRDHGGDPKATAVEIANIVVPQLPRG